MIQCTFENGNKANNGLRHVVIDALVLKDNKILLVRRSAKLSTEPGKWALIGGFMERDEYLQQTVEREIEEESGYRVKDVTLLTVNHHPNQPNNDRQNVIFVFLAQALEKEGEHDWEVSEQQWFDLDNLPIKSEIAFDHYDDILMYKEYIKKPFHLPLFK